MNEIIKVVRCKACCERNVDGGTENTERSIQECAVCQNTGMVIVPPNGFLCVECRGTGKREKGNCELCGGLGILIL